MGVEMAMILRASIYLCSQLVARINRRMCSDAAASYDR